MSKMVYLCPGDVQVAVSQRHDLIATCPSDGSWRWLPGNRRAWGLRQAEIWTEIFWMMSLLGHAFTVILHKYLLNSFPGHSLSDDLCSLSQRLCPCPQQRLPNWSSLNTVGIVENHPPALLPSHSRPRSFVFHWTFFFVLPHNVCTPGRAAVCPVLTAQ